MPLIALPWKSPYDHLALLAFLAQRQIDGVEQVQWTEGQALYRSTLELPGTGGHRGWLQVQLDGERQQALLTLDEALAPCRDEVVRRVRHLLDLDTDPAPIARVLHADFPHGDGLRVPGALQGFALAVRAILGQQVTVAAARTLAQRLAERFGAPLETPWPALNRLFPSPEVLAHASGDALGQLGIVRQRQAAITALARAASEGQIDLQPGADMPATVQALRALPGIGDWTAQYIAMRALRCSDAFVAGDVALHNALGLRGEKAPARAALERAQAWRPWRAYAVLRAWHALPAQPRRGKKAG